MVFHWSLSDSKSPQVSRTFLGILANLNNAIVGMVLILPLISNSFSLFSKRLVTVPSTLFAIGVTVTTMFLARSIFVLIYFPYVVSRNGKIDKQQINFFSC